MNTDKKYNDMLKKMTDPAFLRAQLQKAGVKFEEPKEPEAPKPPAALELPEDLNAKQLASVLNKFFTDFMQYVSGTVTYELHKRDKETREATTANQKKAEQAKVRAFIEAHEDFHKYWKAIEEKYDGGMSIEDAYEEAKKEAGEAPEKKEKAASKKKETDEPENEPGKKPSVRTRDVPDDEELEKKPKNTRDAARAALQEIQEEFGQDVLAEAVDGEASGDT